MPMEIALVRRMDGPPGFAAEAESVRAPLPITAPVPVLRSKFPETWIFFDGTSHLNNYAE